MDPSLLPNPYTSLAFLPPDTATKLEAVRYLFVAVLGAWMWDYFMALREEYRMAKAGVKLSDICYFAARYASGVCLFSGVIFICGPISNCAMMGRVVAGLMAASLPLNSLLFFFRVRAVFYDHPYIVYAFFALWLSTLGTISAPFAVTAANIGPTKVCIDTEVKGYSSAGIVIIGVHDTLVYLAISVKITLNSVGRNASPMEAVRAFFSGKGLGRTSKTLLTSGQMYYLATVGLNIVTMAALLTPTLSPVYQGMFPSPNLALQNAMAARVYRRLKLGLLVDQPSISTGSKSNVISLNAVRRQADDSRNVQHSTISVLPLEETESDSMKKRGYDMRSDMMV
ncbi:hypothetical protein C8Q75DRAFT_722395 [Abortiporus biennis]|nr:hypothetical protein C8Q75DRAFT_722395 [Abortiporus biennis]